MRGHYRLFFFFSFSRTTSVFSQPESGPTTSMLLLSQHNSSIFSFSLTEWQTAADQCSRSTGGKHFLQQQKKKRKEKNNRGEGGG